MDKTQQLIQSLTKEEQQQCLHYLTSKNQRGDVKNVALFQLYMEEAMPQEDLIVKLYGKTVTPNTFHALKKRLRTSVIDFMAYHNLKTDHSIEMELIKNILSARTFLLREEYKTAFQLLDKAQQLATSYALYTFLNEILHTKIQYAPEYAPELLPELQKLSEATHHALLLEDKLNLAYAQLKTAINEWEYQGKAIDFQELFTNTLNNLNLQPEMLSFKSLYQFISLFSFSAFATNNYTDSEAFILKNYNLLQQQKQRSSMLYYHIEVVYQLANVLFRNKKFESSLHYLQHMKQLLQAQKGKYQAAFAAKHLILESLNRNFLGNPAEALALLTPLLHKKKTPTEVHFNATLTAVMIYFQQGELKKAQQLLIQLHHTDSWYETKVGVEMVIKKNVMELLLFIDLGHIDLAETSLKRLRKNYTKYLQSIGQERVLTYLQLIQRYIQYPEEIHAKPFFDTVENSFEWQSHQEEDIFVMCFYAWLKSKMEQTNVYQTTLKLVEFEE